jgi:aspartate carbamoyltransferase catalytic subunit
MKMSSFPSVFESIDDLTKYEIESLLTLAKNINPEIPNPFLKNKIVATSFLENSTRTKHSFAAAIIKLGGHYLDFNAETSSLKKGESLEQTLLTLFNQGIDLCIVRSSVNHLLNPFKKSPPIKLINGGDGTNEHPTQALLDLLTMIDCVGNIEELKGKKVVILGDNTHSRVGHSLIKLLPLFGIEITLCGPSNFLPPEKERLENIKYSSDRNSAIKNCDFLYLLRIQNERHASDAFLSIKEYIETFGVTLKLLKKLNKLIPIFHPGPANVGVEIDQDLINSSLYMGHKQVRNSVPMRMAIMQLMLLNNDNNIGIINGEKF